MKSLLKLTNAYDDQPILVGIGNIIAVELFRHEGLGMDVTKIESRGSMVKTMFVKESVEEIYEMLFI